MKTNISTGIAVVLDGLLALQKLTQLLQKADLDGGRDVTRDELDALAAEDDATNRLVQDFLNR